MPARHQGLHDVATGLLGRDEHVARLARLMNCPTERVPGVVDTATSLVLDRLGELAAGERGPSSVSELLDRTDQSLLDTADLQLDESVIELDSPVANQLFGARLDQVIVTLASKAEVRPVAVDRLFSALIPIVLALVVRRRTDDRMPADEVVAMLVDDRKRFQGSGSESGSDFALLGARGDVAADARGERQSGDGSVESGSVFGVQQPGPTTAPALQFPSSVAKDGPTGAAPTPTPTPTPAPALPQDKPSGSTRSPDDPAPQATAKPARPAQVYESGLGDDADDHKEPSALSWLWWAIGAVVLMLMLAWLLSTCTSSQSSPADGNTLIEIDEPDGGLGLQSDVGSPIGLSNTDDGVGGAPAVASQTEQPAETAPVETAPAETEPAETPETPQTAETAPVEIAPETPAETPAETTEATAETTETVPAEIDPEAARIQSAVDETLAGSAMVGTVTTNQVVVLTGTAGSDGEVNDAVAAIGIIGGVALVDDQVEVVAPAQEIAPAGSTINQLLALEPIVFEVRSARVNSDASAVLDRVVEFLAANPGVTIEVGGHTDNDGAAEENLDLSLRRAGAVEAYLLSQGVDGARLQARGYGESQPLVPNDSIEAKAENRRIEFTIL